MTFTSVKDITGKIWTLGRCLGQGGFARVYETETNPQAVVKIFKSKQSYKRELFAYQSLFTEIRIHRFKKLRGLGHLSIPQLYTHGAGDAYFIVLQKLFPIKQLINEEYRDNNIVMMVVQILDILEFLHNFNWTHNDIKYDNIMTDEYRNFFLIDFGLISTFTGANETLKDPKPCVGTQQYMSLDVHRGLINPPRGDLMNLIFMLRIMLVEPWNIDKHIFSIQTSLLIEKEIFLSSPNCKNFTQFCKAIAELKYHSKPNYKKLKSLLPSQPQVNLVQQFYTAHSNVSQPPWMFSIIFQTQILPFLVKMAKKLFAVKNVKKTLIQINDLIFLFESNGSHPEMLNGITLLGESQKHYSPDARNYISACVEYWIQHMAKELKHLLTEKRFTLNQAISHLTKTLSLLQI